MGNTPKKISRYCVYIGSGKFKFFTEEEYKQAQEFAKENNTYVRLV